MQKIRVILISGILMITGFLSLIYANVSDILHILMFNSIHGNLNISFFYVIGFLFIIIGFLLLLINVFFYKQKTVEHIIENDKK